MRWIRTQGRIFEEEATQQFEACIYRIAHFPWSVSISTSIPIGSALFESKLDARSDGFATQANVVAQQHGVRSTLFNSLP